MENKKIVELLRLRDVCLKKIEKESSRFVAYDTVTGNSKPANDIDNTSNIFQSIHDLLSNACEITSVLRKANVATFTTLEDFWGRKMSVSECRQNMIGDKLVGLPSVHYHLKSLYNKMLKQTSSVNKLIKDHNDSHTIKLKKIKDTEYLKHEEERKSSREQNIELPIDFDNTYELKLQSIVDAFWVKNKATQVDPLDVFNLLKKISDWIDFFDKNKEIQINKANNSQPNIQYDLSYFDPINTNITNTTNTTDTTDTTDTTNSTNTAELAGYEDISLEELQGLIKEKNREITNLIDRLVIVSWKIGNGEVMDQLVDSAKDNYQLILDMIKSYGLMQNAFRIVSTFKQTNYVNPLSKTQMSAVDMADFKNMVIPVITKMLNSAENQKNNAVKQVKSMESSVKTDVIKLLEGSMNSASARPTADKIKEYTNNLMESVMPKVISSPEIEKQIEAYQKLLDDFNSQIKPALSTVNANTKLRVVWETKNVQKPAENWDTIDTMTVYTQSEIVECVSVYDNMDDIDNPDWETINNAWGGVSSDGLSSNVNYSLQRKKSQSLSSGRGRGKNTRGW